MNILSESVAAPNSGESKIFKVISFQTLDGEPDKWLSVVEVYDDGELVQRTQASILDGGIYKLVRKLERQGYIYDKFLHLNKEVKEATIPSKPLTGAASTPISILSQDKDKLLATLKKAASIAGARVGWPILVYNALKAATAYIEGEARRLEDAHQEGFEEGQKDAEDQFNEDGYL